ncbi:MAG TPA: FAD-dependent oxidoreductase [Flavisolibacter sp.]
MKLPFIILVDDDVQVLHAIQRDIRKEYREDYRVVATDSATEALDLVKELKLKNETVALFISDQRMPEMEGIDFLAKAAEFFPEARKVLLTAYSDIEAAIRAINQIHLDYYLLKPWNPPEEKLYPVLNDLLEDWQAFYKPGHEGIRIIGYQWSPRSHTVKEFLSGNLVPYLWLDVEHHEDAELFVKSSGVAPADLPLVVLKDGTFLINPSLPEIAEKVGLQQKALRDMYDVLIIGAGPAGLAASVYGSCEGLKTLLIERANPGGQASSSARIENYLGFPAGLSGAELTRRAITQTTRFGTEILTPKEVKNISVKDGYKIVEMSDGTIVHSRTVIIATGASWTRLELDGVEQFTGAGIYYGAAGVEAHACRDEVIYLVGGGNSACQAALYMSKFAKEVNILIRRDSLKQTAANYLVENISKVPNIKVLPNTEVVAVKGDTVLQEITLRDEGGKETAVPCKALFIYIGARPGTSWLEGLVMKDDKGFIMTGTELVKDKAFQACWKLDREPYMCESNVPGVFAAGDVRMGALTGISSAVGEGAMAIRFTRKYLQEL